jgi:hypothetical protein
MRRAEQEAAMSDTGGSDPQFPVVPGAAGQHFAAAPIAAAPAGPEAIASELGALAEAVEHRPFTAESLAARLEEDPQAKAVAEIAALALVLRGLSPADAATVNRVLAEGPRTKRGKRKE